MKLRHAPLSSGNTSAVSETVCKGIVVSLGAAFAGYRLGVPRPLRNT